MKIKKMNWFVQYVLTWNWPNAITLAPFGIYIKEGKDTSYTINEEKTHWYQQLEVYVIGIIISLITQLILLYFKIYAWWLIIFVIFPFVFYYIWYFIEWAIKVITPPRGAYYDIGFEREAKAHRFDNTYPEMRKHFAWFNRIKS